jgi:hypothetical protein
MRGLPRSCLSVIQGVCRCRCVCTVSSCREVIWTVVYGATTVESVCGAGVLDCRSARLGITARRVTFAFAMMRPTVRSAIPLARLSHGGVP